LKDDTAWARALLAELPAWGPVPGPLLAVLPAEERATYAVRALERAADDPSGPLITLGSLPRPWPVPVGRAVVEWLAQRPEGAPVVAHRPLLDLAAHRLPTELAATVTAVAAGRGDPSWRVALEHAAATG